MQTFEVSFSKQDVVLRTYVDLDDDLILALAKSKAANDEISYKFFDDARTHIKFIE